MLSSDSCLFVNLVENVILNLNTLYVKTAFDQVPNQPPSLVC